MDENQRLDYFRSEWVSKFDQLEKHLEASLRAERACRADLEKKVDDLTRQLHNIKLSV